MNEINKQKLETSRSRLAMNKDRVTAFSDGVIAIIITIMVLELKTPHNASLGAIMPLMPVFLSYILSFVYIGIYWNNHHHMFQAVTRVTGGVLWANLHLLFWLSLVPFVTAWLGENPTASLPATLYGLVLIMSALAYTLLVRVLISANGAHSLLAKAVGKDVKGLFSLGFYFLGILSSYFVSSQIGMAFYVLVAIIWFIPDRRIEHHTTE